MVAKKETKPASSHAHTESTPARPAVHSKVGLRPE